MSDLSERLARLSPERRERLLKGLGLASASSPKTGNLSNRYRASFQQEQLWFVDEFASGRARNHLALLLNFGGDVDVPRLQRALEQVIRKQPALCVKFVAESGALWCETVTRFALDLPVLTVGGDDIVHDPAVRSFVEKPFSLTAEAPYRAALLRRLDGSTTLLWVAHHIVWDGRSHDIFTDAVFAAYVSDRDDDGGGDLRPAFTAHVRQHQDYLAGKPLAADLGFWRDRLEGWETLELPIDKVRPPQASFAGALLSRSLDPAARLALAALSREAGATPFEIYLATMFALMARYTGQRDLILGTSVDGRDSSLEGAVGYFVNMIILRQKIEGEPSFVEFVSSVKDGWRKAFRHGSTPYGKIVEMLRPPRVPGRMPIFQVEFTYEMRAVGRREHGEIAFESQVIHDNAARFDLALIVQDGETPHVDAEFSTDLFERGSVDQLLLHFERLLKAGLRDPATSIFDLDFSDEHERAELERWGRGPTVDLGEVTAVDHFLAQVQRFPDKIAVADAESRLSYRELDDASTLLAARLTRAGVRRGSVVALSHERSIGFVTATLAVLKIGAAYLPFDPAIPPDRAAFMVSAAECSVLVTNSALTGQFGHLGIPLIHTDDKVDDPLTLNVGPIQGPRADDLAYIIYTSGSTGEPKGSAIEHRSLVNCIDGIRDRYGITADDRILHFASLGFDVSVFDTFFAILTGCTLFVASEADRHDPERLADFMESNRVTFAELPAALMPMMPADRLTCLRVVSTGGEKFSSRVVDQWQRSGRRFFNGYGPTEATIAMVLAECRADDDRPPPIGTPIQNHQIYVLDDKARLVPKGVLGELYIGGLGVARGYISRPELTRAAFLDDPVNPGSGLRFYRTGDMVRWRNDGLLEFIGRRDNQIKLNGFRIETGEVDAALLKLPQIVQAATILIGEGTKKRLVSYLVAGKGEERSTAAILSHLRACLPNYMVPSALVWLERLPVTRSGKLARNALPLPQEADEQVNDDLVLPRTELERRVATEVFAAVLDCPLGVFDNFFERGGGSLQAMQAVARIRDHFQVNVSLIQFFTDPSIAGIATLIDQTSRSTDSAGRRDLVGELTPSSGGRMRATNAQMRIWNHDGRGAEKSIYNIPVFLHLEGRLDRQSFKEAVSDVLERNANLRAIFTDTGGSISYRLAPAQEIPLVYLDLVGTDGASSKIRDIAIEQAGQTIAREDGPLVRCILIKESADAHVLLFTIHHLVLDGWSVGVLIAQLAEAYEARRAKSVANVPERSAELEYAAVRRAESRAPVDLLYWRQRLTGTPAVLEWRETCGRDGGSDVSVGELVFDLGSELASRVQAISRVHGVTSFMTLLSVFAAAVRPELVSNDIIIGTPMANRVERELEPIIGCLVNVVPLHLSVPIGASLESLIPPVRDVAVEAYAHSLAPIEALVEERRSIVPNGVAPLFQLLFALQNTPGATATISEVRISRYRDYRSQRLLPLLKFYSPLPELLDLSIVMEFIDGSLVGMLEYRQDRVSDGVAEAVLDRFRSILSDLTSGTNRGEIGVRAPVAG